ncbi:MAG: ribonuclease P protein component [Chlamydiae bacterium]|nr:ribonuclease P protein component [Chlamydiota bacterium]MBI3276418.1 ribonuclease P protein component [Chlamydiota bacterium]
MMENSSFPREERLHQSRDIRWVIETGQKEVSPTMILYFQAKEGLKRQAAFITSKKVGSALRRNRVRRWMREAFRRQKNLFENEKWLVFIARAIPEKNASYSKIFEEMKEFAKKIGNDQSK